jgi:hypothetical protein
MRGNGNVLLSGAGVTDDGEEITDGIVNCHSILLLGFQIID